MDPGSQDDMQRKVQSLESRVALLEQVIGTIRSGKPMENMPKQAPFTPSPALKPSASVKAPSSSKELEVGQKWLSVVGVILVFLAVLFFVQYVFQYLGPGGKVLISYAVAAILFGAAALTRKKYHTLSATIGAGAWGITYLVTYAMYFIPATRVVPSVSLEMFLLTVAVAALLAVAIMQKSKMLVVLGVLLGFLTMVVSPLSLFSIVGTVLLVTVFAGIAVVMPWGDSLLLSATGGYIAYLFWFGNVLGRLPAQGGGLLEKQVIGIIALVLMWLIISAAVLFRRDAAGKAFSSSVDSLTVAAVTVATTLLGVLAIQDLAIVGASHRTALAVWLLLLTGLTAGWSLLAFEYRKEKDPAIVSSVAALILLMASAAYFLPENSYGTALVWSAVGLIVILIGVGVRNMRLAATSIIPLIGSVVRFVAVDFQKETTAIVGDVSLKTVLGFVLTGVLFGAAWLMNAVGFGEKLVKNEKHIPALVLFAGLVLFSGVASEGFSGAVPSVLWTLASIGIVVAGFFGHWKDARIIGLVGIAATIARVFLHDLSGLDALPRVLSFAVLGGLLLLLGYGYNHNKDKLQQFLDE